MPRKYKSFEKYLKPDHKFNNKVLSKFINCIMLKGKKSLAQNIVYQALDIAAQKIKDIEPLEIFTRAIDNVKPVLEVRSKRIGGATYQVPVQVPLKRQTRLAFRWIIEATRKKKGKPMHVKLSEELMAAYKKEGAAMTTRENVHRMAEANKAFAHYAW